VIGLQLLPSQPLERLQVSIERLRPVLLGAALAVLIVLVAATVPSQGVPPFIYFRF
jgi:alginate O-acetyltransferase complex protein AlgI